MPFDPFLDQKLHLLDGVSWQQFGDPEVASRLLAFNEDPDTWQLPDIDVQEQVVDGPHGAIPLHVYAPRSDPTSALLWLHGGGFAGGDLNMPEAHMVSAELCARSSAVVVSVDYRLAIGGVRYPVPLDDAQAAWQWFAEAYGKDGGRLALGGASAGAALALATAVRERDAGRRVSEVLLLAYPFAHFPNPALPDDVTAEMAQLPRMLRFFAEDVEGMVQNYVGRISGLPVDALPGAAALTGLPSTRVVVSEYDDLRSSAELLIRQLREAGIDAECYLARGMPHGHLNRTPSLPEVERSLAYLAAALGAQT